MEKDKRIYFIVGQVLKICFFTSFGIISLGLILLIFTTDSFDSLQGQQIISLSWLLGDLFNLKPVAWIHLGILSLLFTPFATVLVSFLAFFFSKEKIYSLVSAGVFLILTLSLVLALK